MVNKQEPLRLKFTRHSLHLIAQSPVAKPDPLPLRSMQTGDGFTVSEATLIATPEIHGTLNIAPIQNLVQPTVLWKV